MRKLGEFAIVAKQHDGLRLCAKPANDMEELLRSRGVNPLVNHNIAKFVIEFLGDDLRGFKRTFGRVRRDQITHYVALCEALDQKGLRENRIHWCASAG